MPKKTSYRLTARKGTSRLKGKKLQGVAPQINLRMDKEEGYDTKPVTCNDSNLALVHEGEESPKVAPQASYEDYQSSSQDHGKRSIGIQVDIKFPMLSIGVQVRMYVACYKLFTQQFYF